jgi:hypothetical protein
MASPIINFVSISARKISADYINLPAGSQVVLVDKTSGTTMAAPVTKAEGSGSLSITLSDAFPSGDFYLLAQDRSGGGLAQSVEFYVASASGSQAVDL